MSKSSAYILLAPILLLTAAVYYQALGYGFVGWNDPLLITNNMGIRSLGLSSLVWMFTSLDVGNWIPLTWISYAVDYAWGGGSPRPFHFTNVLLHILNTALVFRMVLKIMEFRPLTSVSVKNSTALLSTFLFALHPIHVESVAWLSERRDVLYGFFYLAAIHEYLEYAGSGRKSRLMTCFLLFVFSLMSKPMAITLPFLLLAFDAWPLDRAKLGWKNLWSEKRYFFVCAAAVGALNLVSAIPIKALGGAEGLPLGFGFMNACHSMVFYAWKVVCPVGLSPHYPFPQTKGTAFYAEYGLSALLVFGFARFAHHRRVQEPLWGIAGLVYLITLAPTLGLLQMGAQTAADHDTYIPALGLMVPFAFWWSVKSSRWGGGRLVPLFLGAVVLTYVSVTQIGVWKNAVAPWERVVALYPGDSALAHGNLAAAYQVSGRWQEALAQYDLAAAIPPASPIVLNGRGTLRFDLGREKEALEDFKRAVELDPLYISPRMNLARCYKRMGLDTEAYAALEEARRLEKEIRNAK